MSLDDLEMEVESNNMVATNEIPKKNTRKSTASKQKKEKEAVQKKVPKTPKKKEVVLTTVAKQKKFGKNTVVNFCNNYFKIINDHSYNFVQYKESKNGMKQQIIDLTHVPEVDKLRKVIESIEPAEIKKISENIYTPIIHTTLDYFKKIHVAQQDKNDKTDIKIKTNELFDELCESLDIKTIEDKDVITNLIAKISEYMHNSKKITSRVYNYVFGNKYSEMFPEKNDVHKRYVQKTPMYIKEILLAKEEDVDLTPVQVITRFKDKFDVERKVMNDMVKLIETNAANNMYHNSNVSKLVKAAGITKTEAAKRLEVYSELKAIYNYVEYIDKLDDGDFFKTEMKKVHTILDEFDKCASEVDKLKMLANKVKKPVDQWKCLIRCLVYATRVHDRFVQDAKKKSFAYLINQLAKNKIYINIKNVGFRKDLEELVKNNAKDVDIDKFATKNVEFIGQLTIPKTYHPRNIDIYNKLGYYVFYNWNYDKEIPKINKTVRVAVGLAVAKYIDAQLSVIKASKQNGKIVIKF